MSAELKKLAEKAAQVSERLWKVNTRAQTVAWCADADEVLTTLMRLALHADAPTVTNSTNG
jgi:hypothetical protein